MGTLWREERFERAKQGVQSLVLNSPYSALSPMSDSPPSEKSTSGVACSTCAGSAMGKARKDDQGMSALSRDPFRPACSKLAARRCTMSCYSSLLAPLCPPASPLPHT